MDDLLGIIDLRDALKGPREEGKTLLALDFPVDAHSAPYLVSTASGLRWVPEAERNAVQVTVRALEGEAPESFSQIYLEVLKEIQAKSEELEWGLNFPLTLKGLTKAWDLLNGNGLKDLECLSSPLFNWREFLTSGGVSLDDADPIGRKLLSWVDALEKGTQPPPTELLGMRLYAASWLSPDHLVVIPKERDFFGTIGILFDQDISVLVHNPTRGIAMLR